MSPMLVVDIISRTGRYTHYHRNILLQDNLQSTCLSHRQQSYVSQTRHGYWPTLHYTAQSLEHRLRGEVLRRDQIDEVLLSVLLL